MAHSASDRVVAKHRIPVGPRLKDVLRVAYRANRPVLMEGETGIGKSEIIHEVAQELGIMCQILDLSLLEPPDLVGLPVIESGRTRFATPSSLPTEGSGILMLEELNRAERYIQQPALQLLTARKLHEYTLPAGWSVCAAINPEEGDYQVSPLDPAMRARFLYLSVFAERAAWINWARAHQVHPAVLRVADSHEQFLEHVPPRTWTYVSDTLKAMSPEELEHRVLLNDVLSGYLPAPLVSLIQKELAEVGRGPGVSAAEILQTYHRDKSLQSQVQSAMKAGQTDVVHQLVLRIDQFLKSPDFIGLVNSEAVSSDAFEALLKDLPGDHRDRLGQTLGDNLAATVLLRIKPEDIAGGGYVSGALANRVAGWFKTPHQKYRQRLIVTYLDHFLRHKADLSTLRNSNGARMGLGHLLDQLDETEATRLGKTLNECHVDVISKKGKR